MCPRTWNHVDRREEECVAEPNLASLFEMTELPADEGIVERIGIGGDERATPINPKRIVREKDSIPLEVESLLSILSLRNLVLLVLKNTSVCRSD